MFAALLVWNGAWILRHCEDLRPIGRGDRAPDVDLPRVDGVGRITLANFRGRVVLIDFWATWCGPCERTMPALKRLVDKHGARGFEVLSINEDAGPNGPAKALAYARGKGLPWPVVHDRGGAVAERYKVQAYPTILLIDKRGLVRQVHVGVLSIDRLEAALDEGIGALLAE
jgi:thiol-disulfide isomerase/thioredoxin